MSIIQQYLVNPCSTTHTRTVSSNTTNLNAQTLFGSDFTADSCKNLIINSGVSIGGTDLTKPALDIPSGMGGSMKIINYGSILGAGGKGGKSKGAIKGIPLMVCAAFYEKGICPGMANGTCTKLHHTKAEVAAAKKQ